MTMRFASVPIAIVGAGALFGCPSGGGSTVQHQTQADDDGDDGDERCFEQPDDPETLIGTDCPKAWDFRVACSPGGGVPVAMCSRQKWVANPGSGCMCRQSADKCMPPEQVCRPIGFCGITTARSRAA